MASTERTIELSPDVKINVVQTKGSANDSPTLIFLHFWGGSSSTWQRVTSLVGSTYPTLAIDFPGWGRSTGPADVKAYSIARLAQDVEEVIAHLGIARYVLVGHSMGGKVAQAVAGRAASPAPRALVLVAPAPPGPLVLPEEARDQQRHAYDTRETAEAVSRAVLTGPDIDEEAVQVLIRDMLAGSAAARAAWPDHSMAEDVTALARRIRVPVLVVGADGDKVETIDRLRQEVLPNLAQAPARLVVLSGSGHIIPLEAPGKLRDQIEEFVKELD